MVMPISNSLSSTAAAPLGTKPPEQVHAFRQLGQALRAGDVDAAKQAYASVVRNAPEGASWNPDGPFAQLGKALADGDVDTAKSVFATMVKEHLPHRDHQAPAPVTTPSGSSTGGTAGGLLSVTA